MIRGRERVVSLRRMAGGFDAVQPDLGRAVLARRPARAVQRDPAMRPGADAEIVSRPPIGEVVPALSARTGVIGDFIGREAGGVQPILGRGEQIGGRVVVHRREVAAAHRAFERRLRFDRQLVEREMVARQSQRLVQRRHPSGFRLPRQRVDQIERPAWEDARGERRGVARRRGVMRAAEKAQSVVIQALNAERDAIDAGGAQIREGRRFDAGRIRLQRDLDVRIDSEARADAVDERGDRRRRREARRPAAEKDAADAARPDAIGVMVEFAQQRRAPTVLIHGVADMAVEVAIGAFLGAERPMQINRQRRRC